MVTTGIRGEGGTEYRFYDTGAATWHAVRVSRGGLGKSHKNQPEARVQYGTRKGSPKADGQMCRSDVSEFWSWHSMATALADFRLGQNAAQQTTETRAGYWQYKYEYKEGKQVAGPSGIFVCLFAFSMRRGGAQGCSGGDACGVLRCCVSVLAPSSYQQRR